MEQVATVDALREALGALKLDTRGHKAVLKKRLRTAKKAPSTQHVEISPRPRRPASQDFDSYLVLDFEATCQQYVLGQGSRFDFPNEVCTSSSVQLLPHTNTQPEDYRVPSLATAVAPQRSYIVRQGYIQR